MGYVCVCVCVRVQASVFKKKESHSKSWERGSTRFALSQWETPLLLLWRWYNLHTLPSSILFSSSAGGKGEQRKSVNAASRQSADPRARAPYSRD